MSKCHDHERLHLHRFVCDLDSLWDQADVELQRVARAVRGTGGAYVLYPGTVDGEKNDRNEYTEILPGLGAFPLSPSHDSSVNIRSFLSRIAEHLCDRVTQWENFTFERLRAFKTAPASTGSIPEDKDAAGKRQNAAAQLRAEHVRAETLEPENIAEVTVYGTTRGAPQSHWMSRSHCYPLPAEIAREQGILTQSDADKKKLLVIVAPIRPNRSPEVQVFSILGAFLVTAAQLQSDYDYYKEPTYPSYWLFRLAL